MDQQAKSMLAHPEGYANSAPGAWHCLKNFAISEIFTNSAVLRVCGTKFAILTPKLIQIDPAMHHNHPATYIDFK
jgi:hypothetical protein